MSTTVAAVQRGGLGGRERPLTGSARASDAAFVTHGLSDHLVPLESVLSSSGTSCLSRVATATTGLASIRHCKPARAFAAAGSCARGPDRQRPGGLVA
jgi:hypothetical protein